MRLFLFFIFSGALFSCGQNLHIEKLCSSVVGLEKCLEKISYEDALEGLAVSAELEQVNYCHEVADKDIEQKLNSEGVQQKISSKQKTGIKSNLEDLQSCNDTLEDQAAETRNNASLTGFQKGQLMIKHTESFRKCQLEYIRGIEEVIGC